MSDVLSIQALTKNYGRKRALNGVSLDIGRGQVFGLLGPNGSGKTTTLGIILGTVLAGSGSFRWFGTGAGARERRRIGALLELPTFYPWLSGAANLRVVSAIKGARSASSEEALRVVGLWDVRHQPFQAYSLGMKQRLALAATLLGNPEVLVLDEPTNGVDAQGIFEIRSIISDYARKGGTVLLASHMLDEVEKVCTHVAILKDGAVLKTGSITSVLATKGWIELAAPDLTTLERALKEAAPGAHTVRHADHVALHGASLTTSELNARLAASGVYVGLLVQRQPSLETQYLQLVGSEAAL